MNTRMPLRNRLQTGTQLYNTAAVSIPDNANTAIAFSNVTRDDLNAYHGNLSSSKIVLPKEGWYLFAGSGLWDSNSSNTGNRIMWVYLNQATVLGATQQGSKAGNSNPNQNTYAMHYCRAYDYVELFVFQKTTGSSLNLNTADFSALLLH